MEWLRGSTARWRLCYGRERTSLGPNGINPCQPFCGHTATHPMSLQEKKTSFLLFGMDCRSPTEAALFPPTPPTPTDLEDYREELIMSLSSARKTAVKSIWQARQKYKTQWQAGPTIAEPRWGLGSSLFPTARVWSQPEAFLDHGPWCITSHNDMDVTVTKVYFAQDGPIQVHQMRVQACPPDFPAGYYWYGLWCKSPGRVPRWIENLSLDQTNESEDSQSPQHLYSLGVQHSKVGNTA